MKNVFAIPLPPLPHLFPFLFLFRSFFQSVLLLISLPLLLSLARSLFLSFFPPSHPLPPSRLPPLFSLITESLHHEQINFILWDGAQFCDDARRYYRRSSNMLLIVKVRLIKCTMFIFYYIVSHFLIISH